MRCDARTQLLNRFQNKVGVPAVYGGLIDTSGNLSLDAVGVRRRGYPEVVAVDDRVHIGSCFKMITAALFGTYVTDGKADWDMPISDLFPDLVDAIAPGWQHRSVAELLCCVSGMIANPPRERMMSGYTDKRPLALQRTKLTELAFSQPPHKPGRFVYSNMSYIVVGAAIDRLSGVDFESALETRLFAPLGITSAGYGPPPEVWGHASRISVGSVALFKGKPANPSDSKSDNPPALSSAGTLHLNCSDWAKLLGLFQVENKLGVVENQIIERILRVPDNESARMSMGWGPVDMEGLSYAAQGSNMLWSATTLMDNERRRIAIVVCNDGRTTVLEKSFSLAQRLMDL